MDKTIKLSKRYGLNPSMPICFFCGQTKNEIVLLGELPQDAEAPKNILIDYEPCEECKTKLNEGITFIEISPEPLVENHLPIQENAYPTGRFATITEEAALRIFNDPTNLRKGKKVLTDQELMDKLLK